MWRKFAGVLELAKALCASRGARGLLYWPHAGLVGAQVGLRGVLSDVFAQAAELVLVADEVVEGVLLPEAALSAEAAVDLAGGEMLP